MSSLLGAINKCSIIFQYRLTKHILCEARNVTLSLEGSALFSGMWLMPLLGFQRGALKKKNLFLLNLILLWNNLSTKFDSACPL